MAFARLYYGGPLLGVVLAVTREYKPLLFDVCLSCDACISGGFSGCFTGFFWLVLVFFGPGAARAPKEIPLAYSSLGNRFILEIYRMVSGVNIVITIRTTLKIIID